ncbi:hypothetical protein BDR05DRAFT_394918 [Suillus weaverae]|nr:hypothetical protein BDR05DRAFT_394918 [Suillus weaverae]
MTTQLHVMYQRSRKILMFLAVAFLAVNITDEMLTAITMGHFSGGELVLSGTYLCAVDFEGGILLLDSRLCYGKSSHYVLRSGLL